MADSETHEFELLNSLKRIVKKVDRRICQMILLERNGECERFVRIERCIPFVRIERFSRVREIIDEDQENK